MKHYTSPAAIMAGLGFLLAASGCDERLTPPETPSQPSYTETKVLLDKASANGETITAEFTLRDSLRDGNLYIYCWIQPDAGLQMISAVNGEISRKNAEIDSILVRIFELWTQGELEPGDSLAMVDSADARRAQVALLKVRLDSLDTWVDDRFKVAVWLDDDTEPYYPLAVQLDSSSMGTYGKLTYLGDSTVVWGQGLYFGVADTAGWAGRRISLGLKEWWRSDPSWVHNVKPERDKFLKEPASGPDRFTRYELLPIRDWLLRLTPTGSHRLHIRFGAPGTVTKVSATLFAVYKSAQ